MTELAFNLYSKALVINVLHDYNYLALKNDIFYIK